MLHGFIFYRLYLSAILTQTTLRFYLLLNKFLTQFFSATNGGSDNISVIIAQVNKPFVAEKNWAKNLLKSK